MQGINILRDAWTTPHRIGTAGACVLSTPPTTSELRHFVGSPILRGAAAQAAGEVLPLFGVALLRVALQWRQVVVAADVVQ